MVVWIFRALRKSLEDDGLIGRVTESTAYQTLRSLRVILTVLQPLLWGVETLFGKYAIKYAMSNPIDRVLFDMFPEPGRYSPLGEALEAPAVLTMNQVILAWVAFDLFLGMLYSVLERFTLEEHEIAQRQYDESRKELGDVDDDGDVQSNFIISLANSRLFRYVFWGVIGYSLLSAFDIASTAVKEELQYRRESGSPEVTAANLAKLNPWRDLLPEHDAVLKELVYMNHVLRELTPTTLPEDDYQLYSDMIRSLETRTDISWRVYEEAEIRASIMAAANRGWSASKPIADEPFSIQKRVKALHSHWHDLALAPGKPERWEDASDTTFLTPLVATHSFGEPDASSEPGTPAGGFKLSLTAEQEAEATRVYTKWRRNRDRKVSYLKIHPPTPMAWVPLSKSDTGNRNAWDTVFDNGRVEAGRSIPVGKLAGNQQWKPLFRSLLTENIPYSWQLPGEKPQTDEESKAELDAIFAESDRASERRAKQNEYLTRLEELAEEKNQKNEL